MTEESAKVLLGEMLHPVRMRIMTTLAGSQGMTPLQMAEALDDVPQATLYRQIGRLYKAGILQIVDERPVRGTMEKVYGLNHAVPAHLGGDAVADLSKEDHLHFFTAFTVTLIDEFTRYLNASPKPDLAADGVGYGQVVLFMSDDELVAFSKTLNQALLPYIPNQNESESTNEGVPSVDRKKRLFSTVFMPEITGK